MSLTTSSTGGQNIPFSSLTVERGEEAGAVRPGVEDLGVEVGESSPKEREVTGYSWGVSTIR